ncbi:MAG TPA: RHS repeat-associated core domain-containing protein [Pyrinomonadaceae bacterium]|nr:RHS repeat-associated core domain-containing protein [Pyrinomonadaceae bacterium]
MSYDDPMYASGKRGLPTTSRIWDSTKGLSTNPGAYIATHATFDSYGNRTVATDAMGNSTTTTYDSTYHAFPVSVTTAAPDQNGGTHGSTTGFTTSIAYDTPAPSKPPLGLPFSTTDGNGQTTMMEYNDELLRPTKVTAPNGQQTITEYGSGTSEATSWVKVKTQIDENNWSEAKSWYDGIGRTYKSEKVDSQGNVFALTCYDQMGRVEKVSNPFRNVSNPNCSSNLEWTVNDYDDLGRISTITSPDSSVMQTAYGLSTSGLFGTTKTVTDQAGKKRKGITDALGRMVRVIEDPDGQNLPTDYVFDALGNLRKTTQGIQNRYFSHDSLGRLLRAKQPEQDVNTALALPVADSVTGHNQWSVSYSYDDNGNISSTTDARNNTVTATYDRLNRIILRDYSDTAMPDVSFYYDGKGLSQTPTCPNDPTKTCANGKTTKVYSSVSETRYTNFDKMGRLLASQQITDGQTYSFGYSYNLSGALIEETYPSGRVVRNTLNQDGELSVVQSKKNSNAGYYAYATHFSYTPAGMIDKMRLGNGTWETYSYNNRLQVKEIGLGRTDSQTDLLKLEYAYNTTNNHDNNGSMLSQKITVPTVGGNPGFTAEQTYTYDALNRLYSATETISGQQTWKQTFDYDRYGNRRFLTTNNATTTLGSCQTKVCNPEISASDNRFIKDQNGDSVNDYDYDANGNLTLDAENQRFVYDTENRQKQFFKGTNNTSTPNATYHYDGEGKRVKKISETETVIFVYDVGGKLAAEYTTALAQTSQIRYLTMDHLGSTRVLTNERGQVTSRKDYGAFGDETLTPQRAGGLSYSPAQEEIRKGFTGYEKDDESGLDFAQARYYNSNHGRFTSVDPLTASASIRNPQTFNRYSYVLNSPYKFTDPLGLYPADMGVHQTTNGFEARESDRQSRKEYWSAMHPPPPPPPISPPTPILPFVPPAEQNAEPVQDQAGTIEGFVSDMNNSPSKIGQVKGDEADKAMRRLGKTDLFGTPMTTGYFNKNKNRYVYTENGGWIDMVHFLFYASKGYMAKKNGMKHPIGEAMQQGYAQEGWIDGKHSSYSYEDLPTDKFGADFGVNYFDPNSNSTLGEQINSYFVNQLKAAAPSSAPNWNSMPKTDDGKSPPTFTNKTTKPLFTKGN